MTILDRVSSPADLRLLNLEELDELAREIREFLIAQVTKTGGHLGPNLGVVELTLAIHRIFDSPVDPILWDTGHQAYVHKIVTGRAKDFDQLRKRGGLSGYPSRDESVHDLIENSHASTALSYADGIAKGFQLLGESHRHVVAVVGDGALTGGMTWEAINNIAASEGRSIVIVVNDNERSYSPTIGGLATKLAALRTNRAYEEFLGWGKQVLLKTPLVGRITYETLHGMKKGLKDVVAPQGLFEDLGLKYIGPIDGHNIAELEEALGHARDFGGAVIVHTITQKGRGYAPAELDEADRFHAVGVVDPETGQPLRVAEPSWTSVFADALVAAGSQDSSIAAVTAAMLGPTGLTLFQEIFPERTFDVGIAEQHAVTSAVGMAHAGLHPVVAIYSTFLNRAFDQMLMDAALHNAPVTFVLDRAGITGDDGPSHNGMWDLSLASMVPGLTVYAPRDDIRLVEALESALSISTGPSLVRFPKGALPSRMEPVQQIGCAHLLTNTVGQPDAIIVAIGGLVSQALDAAQQLDRLGHNVAVVDPVQVLPVTSELIELLSGAPLVFTVEDGVVDGGVGQAIAHELAKIHPAVQTLVLGIPKQFLAHGSRNAILEELGLDASGIAATVTSRIATQVR